LSDGLFKRQVASVIIKKPISLYVSLWPFTLFLKYLNKNGPEIKMATCNCRSQLMAFEKYTFGENLFGETFLISKIFSSTDK
jgi:hypothetical protein